MQTVTVELDWDTVDNIIVTQLKEQYLGFKQSIEDRKHGRETLGIFETDPDKDVAELQKHMDAVSVVLSYNMIPRDFDEWKASNDIQGT